MTNTEIIKDIHDKFKCSYYNNNRKALKLMKKGYLIVISIVNTNQGEMVQLLRYKIGDIHSYCKELYLPVGQYNANSMQTLIENLLTVY